MLQTWFCDRFLRKLKNSSGSTSVQIISKSHGKYKVVKTIGSGHTEQEIREELGKPVIVADAGLLSNDNLKALQTAGYQYILGASIKNESEQIKQCIQEKEWKEGKVIRLSRKDDTRLIVAYSQ